MTNDLDLLKQFAHAHSQDAFAEIVRRHVNLVYSAALRQVRAPQLAEEVAQSVFTDLARSVEKFNRTTGTPPVLTAWLYAVTRRTAIDVIRKESRRQLREQIAAEMQTMNATANDWRHIEPLLDDALAALDETDRTAILLRYFENKDLREVGEQLNLSDDAAQKRVSRAVEKMRGFFSKRNVTIGASGLVILISANAVQSAPAGLALTIANTSLAVGTVLPIMKMTTATKLKLALGAIVISGAIVVLIAQQQSQARLHDQNGSMQQQIAKLQADNQALAARLAALGEASKLPALQFSELLKLRGEVGVLRRQLDAARAVPNVDATMADESTNAPVPQVHIKARFIAIPQEASFEFKLLSAHLDKDAFSGILNGENVSNILQALKTHNASEILAEPEVITTSGHQIQMRTAQTISVVTNLCLQETNGSVSLVPQTETVETGMVFDATPRVLPDDYTIELRAQPSVTDFLGYAPTTDTTPAYSSTGQKIDVPTVSPQFHVEQSTNLVNLLDGQSLLLKLNGSQIPADATYIQADGRETGYTNQQIFVLITPNLVDRAGNLIHHGTETNQVTPIAAQ
ncbi:MAG TPA: sigma-70 family RNA polymerase sigma factor [Verrucomicrobiae bacterium]|jgi:RNA polymerase sigma factor (sigma-70 family)